MSNNPSAIEAAILANDTTKLTALLQFGAGGAVGTPEESQQQEQQLLDALAQSARLDRPIVLEHLLITFTHPTLHLQSHLCDDSFIYAAITSGSIPVWEVILRHNPDAKNTLLGSGGHRGTVLDRCIFDNDETQVRFLVGKGAKIERVGQPPALWRARFVGRIRAAAGDGEADMAIAERIQGVLREAGALTGWEAGDIEGEEEEPEAVTMEDMVGLMRRDPERYGAVGG